MYNSIVTNTKIRQVVRHRTGLCLVSFDKQQQYFTHLPNTHRHTLTTIKSVKISITVKKMDALEDIQKSAETSKSQESVGTTTIVPTNTLFMKTNMITKMKLN